MIKCDTCPRCKDSYPGELNYAGVHFYVCGMTGNTVYKEPWKERRQTGRGWIHHGISSCGIYESIEEALEDMSEPERRRWRETNEQA